ncbi:MAG: alcohol dehydrogenase [Verrucomicrobia bacterium]|nr:MAG: alcohol dehydrogenase [Verrucomicrobiota bacterium]
MNKITIGFALVYAVAQSAPAADWLQWRGPTRDGISAETTWSAQWPASGPAQHWKLNVGTGCSSVVVAQGRLFTMGNSNDTDTVYGLDAASGQALWKYAYPCPLDPHLFEGGPGATPTVDGDHVYTLSRAGQLHCLQAATGKVLWAKQLVRDFGGKVPTWGYTGSPIALDNKLIFDLGAPDAATIALDKLTGNVLWKSGGKGASYGTLMPFTHAGKACLASFNAFGLIVRDAATGQELARYPWKTNYDINATTPIIAGDKIFISSGYNHGSALLQFSGDKLTALWETKKMRNHFNSCVLWQNHLYGFDMETLTCMNFATGEVVWKQTGLGKGSLMLADGKLIIQAERGDLVIAAASPVAFQEIARTKVLNGRCWVVPVLANGRIYCKNNLGDLVCVSVTKK